MRTFISERLMLSVILVMSAAYMWIYKDMTMDDTFIFAKFVNNMIRGHEMSFNPGEPTYGFTSVSWVLMLYVAALAHGDIVLNAKVVSLVFALLSVGAFFLLAKELLQSRAAYYSATAAWAINPVLLSIAFSGMETTLSTFLLILGLLMHWRERASQRLFLRAPPIFALAYLTRPEFLLLFPLWAIDIWVSSDRRLRGKRLMLGTLSYGALIGAWFAAAWFFFGTIVPNPVVIKALQAARDYDTFYIVKRFVLVLGSMHLADFAIVALSLILLLVVGWKSALRSARLTAFDALLFLWTVGVLASYLLQSVVVSPRYFLIVSPVITLLAFRLLEGAISPNVAARRLWPALALLLFGAQSLIATSFIYFPHTTTYNEKDKLLRQVAVWLQRNTPPDAVVASVDIGILGYYSERKVVDQTGLINPDIIHRKTALAYLRSKGVDYLLDRHPEKGQLKAEGRDKDWLEYEAVLYVSTPSAGWTAGLTEEDRIGFTLYRLHWKHGR